MKESISRKGELLNFPENGQRNVNTFRRNKGVPHELLQEILADGKDSGPEKIMPFPVEKIDVAEWVRLKCQYGCCQYNTNWCCPPVSPDLEKTRAILNEYSLALLLIGNRQCKNFYISNARRRAAQVRTWNEVVRIERKLFLKGYDKAFSLVSGACALCKRCTFPKACRFPKERRPPVEALSIDLIGTLRNLGISSPVAQKTCETFRYYAIILLE